MAQLFDVRNNEFQGLIDRIGGQVETDARALTQNLSALNAETLIDVNGANTVTVHVTGTFVASLIVEGSVDGVTYPATPMPMLSPSTGQYVTSTITATATLVQVHCAGFKRLRVRVSAYTSGTAIVGLRGASGLARLVADQIPSSACQTVTAAVNTLTTLTLAAPAAGLFHYIDSIVVQRHVAVAVAAGAAAPVIITTTNLTGAPSFDTSVKVQNLGENDTVLNVQFPRGLKATAAAAATTIVAPANASYIWKITAAFRVGP
jgi:hypothetical protein